MRLFNINGRLDLAKPMLMILMLGAPLGAHAIALNFDDGSLLPTNGIVCGGGGNGESCGPVNGALNFSNVQGSGIDVDATADGPGNNWFVWHDLNPLQAGLGASNNINNTGSDNIFPGEEVSLMFSTTVVLIDWVARNHGNGLGPATYDLFVDGTQRIFGDGLTEGATNPLGFTGKTFRFVNSSSPTGTPGIIYISTAEFRPSVPEPATVALLGLGLLGLGFGRRAAHRT